MALENEEEEEEEEGAKRKEEELRDFPARLARAGLLLGSRGRSCGAANTLSGWCRLFYLQFNPLNFSSDRMSSVTKNNSYSCFNTVIYQCVRDSNDVVMLSFCFFFS